MDIKKFLTGTIAGAVVGFAGGFLIYGFALANYMADNTDGKNPPDFLWLIIGHVLLAAAFTYIFLRWAGIKTAATGAKAAAMITILISLGTNFIWYSVSNLFTGGLVPTVVDAVAATVVWAIAGAAIGWTLGRGD